MALVATIDTLAFAKRLIDAGVPQKQAEAHTEILSEIIEEKLVSKSELQEETRDIKQTIQKLDEKMDRRFNELDVKIDLKNAELKANVVKWVVSVSATQTALIFSVMIAVLKTFH